MRGPYLSHNLTYYIQICISQKRMTMKLTTFACPIMAAVNGGWGDWSRWWCWC